MALTRNKSRKTKNAKGRVADVKILPWVVRKHKCDSSQNTHARMHTLSSCLRLYVNRGSERERETSGIFVVCESNETRERPRNEKSCGCMTCHGESPLSFCVSRQQWISWLADVLKKAWMVVCDASNEKKEGPPCRVHLPRGRSDPQLCTRSPFCSVKSCLHS